MFPARLVELPTDVLVIILRYLSARDLAALSCVSSSMHMLVKEFGWKIHLRLNPRPSHSLCKAFESWDAHAQVRYHAITDRRWTNGEFVARPLSHRWQGKLQPLLAINNSRLFVGAGNTIYSYIFTASDPDSGAPGIQLECSYTTNSRLQATRDITGLVSVPDGGRDRTLYAGYADGALERIELPPCKAGAENTPIEASFRDRREFHGEDLVESLSAAGDYILSLSTNGTAVFLDHAADPSATTPQLVQLGVRSWSAHLCAAASHPYAVFGTASRTPLAVHDIRPAELSPTATAILAPEEPKLDGPNRRSAVYGICNAPPSSPLGSSHQVIISGWYDGIVHIHDLRDSRRARTTPGTGGPAPLLPVLSVYDPWLFEPIYDVAAGGGSSSHIAAGTARHSVVALWDVRAPKQGWSVHGPGNDSSPVYSVVMESSRVFGATQSRAFVLDFGPNVKEETYPGLSRNYREDGLKRRDKSGVGFYVTKYTHGRTREY
ncbi:hypothetical protein CERSUDRAFT_45899 [Gelatoporia subvermispora B]|uniref:F-box domain-containing protein n=1 Tax=Ceriporiopsis subvermispora (strain B) TaxID=914234 RepID=M2R4R6_CERS8|nr:hypothetical protein CERSUDRAFT_45899 [Gelatoporia subvermispora B]